MFARSAISPVPRRAWLLLLFVTEITVGLSIVLVGFPYLSMLLLPIPMVIIYKKPLLGYLLLIAFLPNFGIDLYRIYGAMDVSALEPAVFVAMVGLAIQFLKDKQLKLHITEIELTMFFLYVWASFTIFWAPDTTRAIQQLIKISIGYMIYLLSTTMIKEKKDFNLVVGMWIFLAFVMSSVSIYQIFSRGFSAATAYIFTPAYDKIHKDVRATALLEGADMVGFLITLALIMMVTYVLFLPRGAVKKAFNFVIPIASLAFVAAMSRKSFLGLSGAILFMAFMLPKRSVKKLASYVMVSLMIILLVLLTMGTSAYMQAVLERISSILMEPTEAAPYRMTAWELGFDIFSDSPIIGKGLGSFYYHALEFGSHLKFPHNFFVFMLSELGLIGLSLFILWTFQMGRRFIILQRETPSEETKILAIGMMAALISILIHMFFRSMSLTDPTFWGFLGLTSAFLKINASDAKEEAL